MTSVEKNRWQDTKRYRGQKTINDDDVPSDWENFRVNNQTYVHKYIGYGELCRKEVSKVRSEREKKSGSVGSQFII